MRRRTFLTVTVIALGSAGLAGCSGDQSSPGDGETPGQSTPTTTPTQTPTQHPSTATPDAETPTQTPVPFPDTCQPLPDIDGLPAPPSELTEDSVRSYVSEFERGYAVATNDEYGGVESLHIGSVETRDEEYIVNLSFDAVPKSRTPDETGATPTPLPTDAYTHHAVYRVTDTRMLRELRSHIDDSLFSKTCWTLESE